MQSLNIVKSFKEHCALIAEPFSWGHAMIMPESGEEEIQYRRNSRILIPSGSSTRNWTKKCNSQSTGSNPI